MTFKKLLPLLVLGVCSFQILANEADYKDNDEDSNYMLGLMVASESSIYLGGDDKTQLRPFFQAEWGRYFLEGASLGVKLLEQDDMTFSAAIELDGIFQDDRGDSYELSDMESLDSVLMASLKYEYETDFGELSVALAADVSGGHDGYEAELSYSYPIMFGGWRISPEIGVSWQSKEINQYFYGVTDVDVKAGRPLYTPDAGVNFNAGIMAMYPFNQHHSLILLAEYESYSSEVTDSPIVVESSSTSFGLGYVYRF